MAIHDAHCHFFSPAFFATIARQKKDLPPGAADPGAQIVDLLGWDPPGTPEALADRWAAELDRHGIGRAVLIASVPGDEASVAAAVARHPSRFVGFYMLNPVAPSASEQLQRGVGELGLSGICLFPAMHLYRLDDQRVNQVFETAASRPGTAVFVHCGVLSIGVRKKLGLPSPFDIRLGDPLALVQMALRHPQVPVIVPHFGAGFFREALMAGDLCPSIRFDTSSSNAWIRFHPGLDLAGAFRQALAVVGPDRLLFGTDSSFFPRGWQPAIREQQEQALAATGAAQDVIERVFFRNFEALFPAAPAAI
jgi:uncharacterized protein